MTSDLRITSFAAESNRIEGITSEQSCTVHALALKDFLALDVVRVRDVEDFVSRIEPYARLRNRAGLDVFVGDHVPPPGGPKVQDDLERILRMANGADDLEWTPYQVHQAYETLHPFTDGNGRSGRTLWAWQMLKTGTRPGLALGFLHCWYYQSLSAVRS